jgi:hypothetical protein
MSDPLYLSQAVVEPIGKLQRRARIALGTTIEMGVHGPVVDFYKLAPERPLPLPVDYVVAAAGG